MLFFMDNVRVCVKGDESERVIGCLFDVCLSCLFDMEWTGSDVCSRSCYVCYPVAVYIKPNNEQI